MDGINLLETFPKDIVGLVRCYTEPIQTYELIEIDSPGRHLFGHNIGKIFDRDQNKIKRTVYTRASPNKMNRLCEKNRDYNKTCMWRKSKLLYINNQAYVLQPVDKVVEPKQQRNKGKKAKRCKGYTIKQRRCKMKTFDKSEYCPIHKS